jgi:hypothetical protein
VPPWIRPRYWITALLLLLLLLLIRLSPALSFAADDQSITDALELRLDDLEALGSAFLAMRLSEIQLAPEQRAPFGVLVENAAPRRQASTFAARTLLAATSDAGAALRLARWGAAVVETVAEPAYSRSLGNALLSDLDAKIAAAPRRASDGAIYPGAFLKKVHEPELRHDFPLDLSAGSAGAAALEAIADGLGDVLTRALGGDALLVECAVMVTRAGALTQPAHNDNGMWRFDAAHHNAIYAAAGGSQHGARFAARAAAAGGDSSARAVTAQLLLSDVDDNFGVSALELWPGTHTHFFLADAKSREAWSNATPPLRIGGIAAGAGVLYDSRVLHRGCGAASTAAAPRIVAYATWREVGGGPPANGSTNSLRAEYKGVITLATVIDRSYHSVVDESSAHGGPDL